MLLAGDIGGTNCRFGLYEKAGETAVFERKYRSADFSTLEDAAVRFMEDATEGLGGRPDVAAAALGVAGPIEGNVCRATNLPWVVDGRRLGQRLSVPVLRLLNDFEAVAHIVPHLTQQDVRAIGGGMPQAKHPVAVLGPGTGLGTAFLRWNEPQNAYDVFPSEAGHVDFAARTPLETGLLEYLKLRYGRVSNERVLCGQGLVDIFSFLTDDPAFRALVNPDTRDKMAGSEDRAAVISGQGMPATEGQAAADPVCQIVLSIFTSALGAVAGNAALTLLTTGGVYIAGGIAPRIVSFMERSGIRESFEHKGRFRPLVQQVPLFVITGPNPGLRGAAAYAARLV